MIGLCTDSNSQLPAELVERYGVAVVPLTVTIDGEEYLEGIDLDADGFYARFEGGRTPEVSTSQPSPGQFALAYDDLVAVGCTQILSIHVGSAVSGTLNAARLGARSVPVPVRFIDTGTASFGISCCVWAAAEALRNGASVDEAATLAEQLAPRIGNVFVVGGFDLVRASGRVDASSLDGAGDTDAAGAGAGVPVLSLVDGQVRVVHRATDVGDAVAVMAREAITWADHVRVAVGLADQAVAPLADALAHAVGESANVVEVVRYRVGPSVGAHTGPGTVGLFVFPAE